jgi:hypothetical protein
MTDKKMARIVKEIEIDGKRLIVLFDTGSTNTYIRKEAAPVNKITLKHPFRVGLGGKTREIKEMCLIEGEIEGLGFSTESKVM